MENATKMPLFANHALPVPPTYRMLLFTVSVYESSVPGLNLPLVMYTRSMCVLAICLNYRKGLQKTKYRFVAY